MSEHEEQATQSNRSSPTDWIWWSVLVVSCLVGFGLTLFAPT